MNRLHIYRPSRADEPFDETHDLEALPALLAEPGTVVWAALEQPDPAQMTRLIEMLHLHPLAVEDLRENGDRPRLRRNGDRLSIVFVAARRDPKADGGICFVRMNILTAPGLVVTIVHEPLEEVCEALTTWRGNADHLPEDEGGPLYAVLDTLIDDFFPLIDEIADRVDDMEDQVVEQHAHGSLELIFSLKKAMLHFRRVASGARDVVNVLLRHDDLFEQDSSIFFQDLYDHTVRVTDSIDTYRDLLSNAMDTYLSVSSNQLAESANRLNVVMQTLTSWSIILGSGTFIAGIYGMNVSGLPLATHPWSFLFTAGLCLAVAAALFAVFRRKRWV